MGRFFRGSGTQGGGRGGGEMSRGGFSSAPSRFNRGGGRFQRGGGGGGRFNRGGGGSPFRGGRGFGGRGGGDRGFGRGRGGDRGARGGGFANGRGGRNDFQNKKKNDEEGSDDEDQMDEDAGSDVESSPDSGDSEVAAAKPKMKQTTGVAKKGEQTAAKKGAKPAAKTAGSEDDEDDDGENDEEGGSDDEELSEADLDDEDLDEEDEEEEEEESGEEEEKPVAQVPKKKQEQPKLTQKQKAVEVKKDVKPAAKKVESENEDEEEDEEEGAEDEEDSDDLDDEDLDEQDDEEEESEEDEEMSKEVKRAVEFPKKNQPGQKATQKEQSKKALPDKENQRKRTASDSSTGLPESKRPRNLAVVPADKKIITEEAERKKQRDRCTLFIKNLPKKISEQEIKELSSDIKVIRRKNETCRYGWICFASEEICEKNYHKLQKSTLGGCDLVVDFCGEKSKTAPAPSSTEKDSVNIDPMSLYIGNLSGPTSVEEMKSSFPTAVSFNIPKNKKPGDKKFAFAKFANIQDARAAFEKSKNLKIGGVSVTVNYSKLSGESPAKKSKAT